jgi:hypothetical protein
MYLKTNIAHEYYSVSENNQGVVSAYLNFVRPLTQQDYFSDNSGKEAQVAYFAVSIYGSSVRWRITASHWDVVTSRKYADSSSKSQLRIYGKALDFNALGDMQRDFSFARGGIGWGYKHRLRDESFLGIDITPSVAIRSFQLGEDNFPDFGEERNEYVIGASAALEAKFTLANIAGGTLQVMSGADYTIAEHELRQIRLEARNIWTITPQMELLLNARLTLYHFNGSTQDVFFAGAAFSAAWDL